MRCVRVLMCLGEQADSKQRHRVVRPCRVQCHKELRALLLSAGGAYRLLLEHLIITGSKQEASSHISRCQVLFQTRRMHAAELPRFACSEQD